MADPHAIVNVIMNDIMQLQNSLSSNDAVTTSSASWFLHVPPLQANQMNVLDLNTKENCPYYQLAMKPLIQNNEQIDVEPDKFQTIINLLLSHGLQNVFASPNMNCMIPADLAILELEHLSI